LREDHSDGDQKEYDASRHADRLLIETKKFQDVAPKEQKHQQDKVRNEDLPYQYLAPPGTRNFPKNGKKQRDISQRVHNQDQGHNGGVHVHIEDGTPRGRRTSSCLTVAYTQSVRLAHVAEIFAGGDSIEGWRRTESPAKRGTLRRDG
jgi:hypothetical protein